jgi:hypothetical protein
VYKLFVKILKGQITSLCFHMLVHQTVQPLHLGQEGIQISTALITLYVLLEGHYAFYFTVQCAFREPSFLRILPYSILMHRRKMRL